MNKLEILGIFGLGFLLGVILFSGLYVFHEAKKFKEQYYWGIQEVTHTAYMVREGREDQLVRHSEANIRQCVVAANRLWGDTEARLEAFSYVQRYYQRFNLDIPTDIKPILDGLPPRPPRDTNNTAQEDPNSK